MPNSSYQRLRQAPLFSSHIRGLRERVYQYLFALFVVQARWLWQRSQLIPDHTKRLWHQSPLEESPDPQWVVSKHGNVFPPGRIGNTPIHTPTDPYAQKHDGCHPTRPKWLHAVLVEAPNSDNRLSRVLETSALRACRPERSSDI